MLSLPRFHSWLQYVKREDKEPKKEKKEGIIVFHTLEAYPEPQIYTYPSPNVQLSVSFQAFSMIKQSEACVVVQQILFSINFIN